MYFIEYQRIQWTLDKISSNETYFSYNLICCFLQQFDFSKMIRLNNAIFYLNVDQSSDLHLPGMHLRVPDIFEGM